MIEFIVSHPVWWQVGAIVGLILWYNGVDDSDNLVATIGFFIFCISLTLLVVCFIVDLIEYCLTNFVINGQLSCSECSDMPNQLY
jgi:hypothetical protein